MRELRRKRMTQRESAMLDAYKNKTFKAYLNLCSTNDITPKPEEINLINDCFDYGVLANLTKKYEEKFIDTVQGFASSFCTKEQLPEVIKDKKGDPISTNGLLVDFYREVLKQ